MSVIDLCERGLVPDTLMRMGMRKLMARRLRDESGDHAEGEFELYQQRLAGLRASPIAESVDKANEQHYELPAEFFQDVLGSHLKYSACHWDDATQSLDQAEARMLALTCSRAQLSHGQDILELGCGWGSLTLWIASQYPGSRVTAISNSATQREFILERCKEQRITNVKVITADVNKFATEDRFDRVVSIEMFEHMRNYELLMERIAMWLKPGGKLFVHIFCHRNLMYPFTVDNEDDWMGRYFFTGGLMPSEQTLLYFQEHLKVEEQWRVSGTHYERTANAWLQRMDQKRASIRATLEHEYGSVEATRWLNRWRMFFMAVAELFGYRDGTEWMVDHYRFAKPSQPS